MKKYEVALSGGTKVELEFESHALSSDWATFYGEDASLVAAFPRDKVKMVVEKDKAEVRRPATSGEMPGTRRGR